MHRINRLFLMKFLSLSLVGALLGYFKHGASPSLEVRMEFDQWSFDLSLLTNCSQNSYM